METQDITLQKEIRGLEKALKNAVYNGDAFEQMALHKKLEVAKSVIELYEYRVNALLKKIDFLEAQLEISKQFNFKF